MSEQQFNVVLDSFVLTFKGLKTIGPDGSITCIALVSGLLQCDSQIIFHLND